MNIKTSVVNGIKVTCVDIDKFKSIYALVCFKTKFEKDMIVTRNYIRGLLLHSTKKYPTNTLLNKNCLENYDSDYLSNLRMDGNYLTNMFMFRCLDERYIKKEIINNVVDTFNEIIFNPNVKNNEFDNDEFLLAKQTFVSKLEREKEDARSYVNKKMDAQMGDKTPLNYHATLDMLDKITNEDVYNDYLNMINNSETSVFIAGYNASKVDLSKIINNLKSKSINIDLKIKTDIKDKMTNKKEDYNGLQSILSVGVKLDNLTPFESSYVVPVFNNILGGGASSRLFNDVREKNSLCYYCYSSYEKDCNIIRITSGIEYQNYKKTLELIKCVVNGMNIIKEGEVKRAVKDISSALMESLDVPSNYVIPMYVNNLYKEKNTLEKIEDLKKVTKEDVEKIFSKLKITDSFFLKGGKTGEED